MIVSSQITMPPGASAVILYVCVPTASAGIKFFVPFRASKVPTAGEAVVGTTMTDDAFVEPQVILSFESARLQKGSGFDVTVICLEHVAVPPRPVAVIV